MMLHDAVGRLFWGSAKKGLCILDFFLLGPPDLRYNFCMHAGMYVQYSLLLFIQSLSCVYIITLLSLLSGPSAI